jgi:hypothetical protein
VVLLALALIESGFAQEMPSPPDSGEVVAPAAPSSEERRNPRSPEEPRGFLDVGFRLDATGNVYLPTEARWPALGHIQGAALLRRNAFVGGSFEMLANPRPLAYPFVAEFRVGWWETAFGNPTRRGPFKTLPGLAMTYVGWRWVHDHYTGDGGQWSGTGDAAGLILGYTRAAPFGELTVLTDTQFSLYLLGWKYRESFPLGLINQRLSVGWDPIFLDARVRFDPGTGNELSAGISFQSMF